MSGADRIQVLHPLLKRWVLLCTRTGRILRTKRTRGPFKGVPKREVG